MAVRYKFVSESAGEQGYNWTDRCFVDLENERFNVKEHNYNVNSGNMLI